MAAIQPPNTATGSAIQIMDSFDRQFFVAANIIDLITITPIDQNTVLLEMVGIISDYGINHCSRHHHPIDTWQLQFGH